MKKIKVKNLFDLETNNIDEIYDQICNELEHDRKLRVNEPKEKVIKPKEIKSKPSKKDDDLLLSMTKRLNLVETKLKESTGVIAKKDKEINDLKTKLDKLQKPKDETNQYEDINAINDEQCPNCSKFLKQLNSQSEYIDKLYGFLKENGITIVNCTNDEKAKKNLDNKLDQLENDLNNIKHFQNEDSIDDNEDKSQLPQQIDIKVLTQRINQLNDILYQDGASSNFESEDGKIFKMAHRKEISITFFQNGFIIEGYQFLPYNSSSGQKVLHDILDGYSPYILKERYPKGVLLKTVNSLKNTYDDKTKSDNITKVDSPKAQQRMSAERFLEIFPEKVIKNGTILNIREDMERYLTYKSNKEYNLDKEIFNLYEDSEKIDEKDIAKIKVKINIVDKIVNVHMKRTDTIKTLFNFIKEYSNQSFLKQKTTLKIQTIEDYALVMNYPFKVLKYTTEGKIDELGLYPSIFLTFDVLSKYIQLPQIPQKP